MAMLVWIAVALCMLASVPAERSPASSRSAVARRNLRTGATRRRPPHGRRSERSRLWQVSPTVPTGDEPHYLVITQSLLKDGDLRIENNHRQRDYREYFDGEIAPDFRVLGRNREIYSIHAPGVSVLVAPAFALGGYYGAALFLLILSGATAALAWHLAFLVTGRSDAAWFGWASVALSATFLFHTFTVYPDAPGALAVLTGVWALLRTEREAVERTESVTPWLLHGAALATLPWLHTRFAVLAGGLAALIVLRLGRTPNALAKAGAFVAVPVVSAGCWIGYFMEIYGTPDPAAPYAGEQGSFAFVPDGLAGLLFDQRFGVIAYAPVILIALCRHRSHAGSARLAAPRRGTLVRDVAVPPARDLRCDVVGRLERAGTLLRPGTALDGDPCRGRMEPVERTCESSDRARRARLHGLCIRRAGLRR